MSEAKQVMDVGRQIELFKEFFETHCMDALAEQLRAGEKFIIVEFGQLSEFVPDLAELLLENPEDTIRAAELAVERTELVGDKKNFRVRFRNPPESQNISIRDIRSKHIGELLQMKGLVRNKSDVRPQVTSAKFECPSCGVILPILQLEQKFQEPTQCSCGRKGKFRLLSKELVDAQRIVLEEAPEDIDGGAQPKRLSIFLKNDLVSPLTDKRTNPGSKISVVGVVKEVPIILQTGGQSTRYDLICDSNYVEMVEQDFMEIGISKDEEEEIHELSKNPDVFGKLVRSIAPTIFGHERIKEALVLQLLGGCRKRREHGAPIRGDIHILLIGDPGSGKSQLLKRISQVAPKARFTSGKGASGAGLTATVVRDDFLRGWALEAGAIVLANGGILCLDEMDKMSKEDTSGLHEALEQQTVSVSKANIQATLRAETTVLAAATRSSEGSTRLVRSRLR
ncbi:MAG: minichromosome maintenance protein MCM [Nitrosarchaeum sp.]|nr:minichromosome maintenance protein MCM [Nitrosarchaeum sp.]